MPKFATIEEYVSALPDSQQELTGLLLPVIEEALPGIGALWHGHPVWSLGPAPGRSPVCFVKAYPAHVAFGFWRGQSLPDSAARLRPGAREMASVKLRVPADVDPDLFACWLRAARELETGSG